MDNNLLIYDVNLDMQINNKEVDFSVQISSKYDVSTILNVNRIALVNEDNNIISSDFKCVPMLITLDNGQCVLQGYIHCDSSLYSKYTSIDNYTKFIIELSDANNNNIAYIYNVLNAGCLVSLENIIVGNGIWNIYKKMDDGLGRLKDNSILSKYDEAQIQQLQKDHAAAYSKLSAITIEKEVVENKIKDVEFRYGVIQQKHSELLVEKEKLTKKLEKQNKENKKLMKEINMLKKELELLKQE